MVAGALSSGSVSVSSIEVSASSAFSSVSDSSVTSDGDSVATSTGWLWVLAMGSLVSTAAQLVRRPATISKPRSFIELVSPYPVVTKLHS